MTDMCHINGCIFTKAHTCPHSWVTRKCKFCNNTIHCNELCYPHYLATRQILAG